MQSDLLYEFEEYDSAYSFCIAFKDKFGGTSAIKLQRLTIKFNIYKK